MRDYDFGNLLYKLRIESGYTQKDIADMLGVTDKAVSKWENGIAKPTTNNIKLLSTIYNVSVEELLNGKDAIENKKIIKVVLTGGPCAGKTTAMNWIQNFFQKQGYGVLFVPETATELISNGLTPWDCVTNTEYQKCQMKLQLEKEKVFDKGAEKIKNDKVLIVCDRGMLDNKAYMTQEEFKKVLKELGLNEVEIRDNYDAVFHLVTAAKGADEFYNLDNAARTETKEEAKILDDKIISAWTGHPHLRIIDNSTDFEEKMKRLLKEISNLLGEPEPYEIERKFLIKYPDIKYLESLSNCQKVQIVQTYLKSKDKEVRVRQRGLNGKYTYSKTEKINVSDIKRIEKETRLTQEEYIEELVNMDINKGQIIKDRYCLTYKNQYFEIDVYPFSNDLAILEIELNNELQEIEFPYYLDIVKEVTDDPSYRNSNLAKTKVLKR